MENNDIPRDLQLAIPWIVWGFWKKTGMNFNLMVTW